jgi:hypothetical protein
MGLKSLDIFQSIAKPILIMQVLDVYLSLCLCLSLSLSLPLSLSVSSSLASYAKLFIGYFSRGLTHLIYFSLEVDMTSHLPSALDRLPSKSDLEQARNAADNVDGRG